MNIVETSGIEQADISDICVATFFEDGIPNTLEAKKYLAAQTEMTDEGMKIGCARCGRHALMLAGVENLVNADCRYE